MKVRVRFLVRCSDCGFIWDWNGQDNKCPRCEQRARSRNRFVMLLAAALLGALMWLLYFTATSHAGDISTWRYGSPGDIRRAGIHAAARGDHIVTARWMDIAFRAGSPHLYRYTMPQGRQIVIINNQAGATNSAPAQIIDYGYRRPISYRVPRYPSSMVP